MAPKTRKSAAVGAALSPMSDISAAKVDSPSERMKEGTVLEAGDIDITPVDLEFADDSAMLDETAIEDDDGDDEEPPYKRICRNRDSALSIAMNELTRKSFAKPIIVRVGSPTTNQDFHIHAARLADSSPYFEAELSKLVDQGKEDGPLELPEDDPTVFQLYAHFIYDKTSIADLDLTTSATDSRTASYDTYIDLLQSYIFGEKIQNSDFQNEVMNRILQCIGDMHNGPTKKPQQKTNAVVAASDKKLPSTSYSSSENIVRPLIELLYPSLPPDSIGRGLVVETFIVLWSHSDNLQNFVPDLTRELLTEIAEMLLSGDKDHIRDAWAQAIDGDYSYYHSARYDEH